MAPDEFSKTELVSILEIIEDARHCDTSTKLKKVMLKAKDLVSAERAICGLGKLSPGGLQDVVSIVNGNYPESWLRDYRAARMYLNDPIVRYHTNSSITQFWDDIFKRCDDRLSGEVIGFGRDHGLNHGISSSVYIPDYENISIFAFAHTKHNLNPHNKKIVEALTLHLNNALVNVTYNMPLIETARAPFLEISK